MRHHSRRQTIESEYAPSVRFEKKIIRDAAARQNLLEERRDAEWAVVGICGDVRKSILARIKENPQESLNLYSNFRPLNVNEIDFQYALIWGQQAELAKLQSERAECVAEEKYRATIAELEKSLTDKIQEIIVFFLMQTPGYDDLNASYSAHVLVPAIRILKDKNNIWANGKLLRWAEEHWKNNRPCVQNESNRQQIERNEEIARRKREILERKVHLKIKKDTIWFSFKTDILPLLAVCILIILGIFLAL